MAQNLVIVESPTKARTLSKFLGGHYKIEASMGHIRDLPKSELGVDELTFEPRYIIPRDKKKKVGELKKLAEKAKKIYLATDPDREGEAIAWHLAELLSGKDKKKGAKPVKEHVFSLERVVFHEITEGAIKDAFNHPRQIDYQLVDAQQARRVLDRLVGYKLSPLLWKKVKRGLSAGRVQTVALRLIVEREREVEAFKPVEYWSIDVELEKDSKESFLATLLEYNGKKIEIGNLEQATLHVQVLENSTYRVSKVVQKEVRRFSPAPFTTSTLQQTAGNKFGFTAKKTMMLAQNLYEQGFITYMRTDSVNLSTEAVGSARELIAGTYGAAYLPSSPKTYKSKSKNIQEAHEAIRPTNIRNLPELLKGDFTKEHKRLYDLIWKRTVASQMSDGVLDQVTVDIKATSQSALPAGRQLDSNQAPKRTILTTDKEAILNTGYLLRSTGSVLKFDGWLKLYGVTQVEEENNENNEDQPKKQVLPKLQEDEDLTKKQVLPAQHFTQPPPRYTEASLIKKLEELGIGRPSTYAPILSTIQDRFYVERQERKFVPTVLGKTVADFLLKYFPDIFDYAFTASMEESMDEISRGEKEWKEIIKIFYQPLESKLEKTMETAERVELPVETVDINCPDCGKPLIVRTGRFGKFLACSGFPDCKHTEALEQKLGIICPKDGGDVVLRKTKKGRPFYGCKNYPKCDFASWTKPK